MARKGERSVVEVDDHVPAVPRVVEEAEEVLSTYTWQVVGAGTIGALIWAAGSLLSAPLPLSWLMLLVAVLTLLYLVPITREPRLARDVLRRWDELRVERALERSGVTGDPRLEVAESMAERVLRHPSVDERVRGVTRALIRRLERLLDDLRRVEWLARSGAALDEGSRARSISDLQDLLDARVANLIGQLAELHRTVVLRDASALERAMGNVEDLLHELEAEREVERLLSDAERGG
jgi:hypothetical protein